MCLQEQVQWILNINTENTKKVLEYISVILDKSVKIVFIWKNNKSYSKNTPIST